MFKFFAYSSIGSILTVIIQFVYGILIARIVSPEEFGIVAIPLIISSIGRTLVDSGIGGAIVRDHKVTITNYSTVLRFSVILGLFFSFIILIFSNSFVFYFEEPRMIIALNITAICIFFYSFHVPYNAYLIRDLKFKLKSKILVLSTFFAALLSIYSTRIFDNIIALMFYPLFNSIISSILFFLFCKGIVKYNLFSSVILKRYLKFGVNTTFSSFLISSVDWLLQTFSLKYFGVVILGNFAQAKKTCDLQINLVKGNISNVLYSIVSKDQNSFINRKYIKFCIGSILLYSIIILVVLFFSEFLINILFGAKWLGMKIYFDIMLFNSIFLLIDSMLRMSFKSVNQTKTLLFSDSIKVITLILIFFAGIKLNFELSTILWIMNFGWALSICFSSYLIKDYLSANKFDLFLILIISFSIGSNLYFNLPFYIDILILFFIVIKGVKNNSFKSFFRILLK